MGLAVAIAIFAMHIDPGGGDLQRYFATLDIIKQKSLYETIEYYSDGLYAENILVWLVAKTGNFPLLPAISTGIVYYVAMYITAKTAEVHNQEDNIKWLVLAQLLLLPLVSIAHNVRNVLAFALLTAALYRDIYLKKMNICTCLLYVAGALMHTTAILLILVRVVLPIIRKSYLLIVFGVICLGAVLNIGYTHSYLFEKIPIIQKVIVKAHNYLGDSNSEYGQIIAASSYQRVLRLVFILLTFFVVVLIVLRSKEKNSWDNTENITGWFHIVFFVGMFVLFCCVQYTTPAYWRFFTIISMTLGTIFLPLCSKNQKALSSKKFQLIMLFGMAATTLNLYAAFTDYNVLEWITRFIINQNQISLISLLDKILQLV